MRQKIVINCLFAFSLIVTLLACNQQEKKEESTTATTDTAAKEPEPTPAAPAATETIDAVKAAPTLYKVAKDSAGIRILEVAYNPGDSSPMHSHPDNVLYVVNGGKTEFTEKDGTKHTMEFKNGFTGILAGGTHAVKNVGKSKVNAILVEVSRPDKPGAARDAASDPTKVSPTVYKSLADSANIRVLAVTLKPGATSPLHSHPDNAIYVIEGGSTEMSGKDGSKHVLTLPKGASVIMPAGDHSVKNIGKTTVRVLMVEVNRPAQIGG